MREYRIISPSLDGILAHESISYGGIQRPVHILKLYDGPGRMSVKRSSTEGDRVELERYLTDLYEVFMKRLSHAMVDTEITDEQSLVLIAMLQEMIKVKHILLS